MAPAGCKRARPTGPTPAIEKVIAALPKVMTTGNEAEDGDRTSRREMLIQIITECLLDDSHIMNLHSTLLKRKRSKQGDEDKSDDMMEPFATFGRAPEVDRIDALVTIGDFTNADVVKAKRQDAEADRQLMLYALGVGATVKVPEQLRVRKVYESFVQKRHADLGSRLAKFKANGGFDKTTGALKWSAGVYQCEFDEGGKLMRVTHLPTKTSVPAPSWCGHVTGEWLLQENWSDATACIEKKPAPAIVLRTLFGNGLGPNKATLYKGGKCTDIDTIVAALHKDYVTAKEAITVQSASSIGASTAECLKEMKLDKAKVASSAAREKAVTTLKRRQSSRMIEIGNQ